MKARHQLVLLLAPGALAAQAIPQVRIAGRPERLSHEFAGVTSMREIADGRVIITDGREQRVPIPVAISM